MSGTNNDPWYAVLAYFITGGFFRPPSVAATNGTAFTFEGQPAINGNTGGAINVLGGTSDTGTAGLTTVAGGTTGKSTGGGGGLVLSGGVDGSANHGPISLVGLPASDPHVAGQLWLNSHVVTVSAG